MSKIVVLTGSVRRGGNTDLLANSFAEGAGKNNDVEILSVADYKVNPCIGCNSCFIADGGTCVQNDDMSVIYNKLKNADILVIASPVYFYGITAQLKAVIDRLHTPMKKSFAIKKLALILVGAANSAEMFDSIILQYKTILNYFNLNDAGIVLARGAKDKGDVIGKQAMIEAYNLGLSLN